MTVETRDDGRRTREQRETARREHHDQVLDCHHTSHSPDQPLSDSAHPPIDCQYIPHDSDMTLPDSEMIPRHCQMSALSRQCRADHSE